MTDDYPTCRETYVTLRIYHESIGPDVVTNSLGLTPTESQKRGDSYEQRGRTVTCPVNGWFLRSEGSVMSYDSLRHLEWLLDRIKPKRAELIRLKESGHRMDICCLWDSDGGHGGPTLTPAIMWCLAEVGIDLWFDVYFHGAYHKIKKAKQRHGETSTS